MWNMGLLAIGAALTAIQCANGIGVSSWERLLAVSMEEIPDTGLCGSNKCYLKDGTFQYVLNQGESIVDPNDMCYKYTCEKLELIHQKIVCEKIDYCNDGRAPVRLPKDCCPKCEGIYMPPGGFEEWTDWTECSRTCGGGRRARTRKCHITEEENYVDCTGSLTDIEDCQTNPCPVDCEWEWGEYGECSASCGGGTRTRYPTIIQQPQFGGKPCPPNVRANGSDFMECNTQACSVDCVWHSWTQWSECTAECGGGSRTRTRGKTNEKHGGQPCTGSGSDIEMCNEEECPVDCYWKPWGPWTTCSLTCEGGTTQRSREKVEAQHGGQPCVGDATETKECNVGIECTEPCGPGEYRCIDECIADKDKDCIQNSRDNCPEKHNVDQTDFDRDGKGDACDNCPRAYNPNQENHDDDETGDLCDEDDDNDFTFDQYDNCPAKWNIDQLDRDGDGIGDACDTCVYKYNRDNQKDSDGDGVGDACEGKRSRLVTDYDRDGFKDGFDNCKYYSNPDQKDIDRDRQGDICDNCPNHFNPDQKDRDGDGIGDTCDNCPRNSNPDQMDSDGDCIGDVCDTGGVSDRDGDGVPDKCDNCQHHKNPDQKDTDGDGWGDVCDNCPLIYLPYQHNKKCYSSAVQQAPVPVDSVSRSEEKYLVVKIMETLLEMYYSN